MTISEHINRYRSLYLLLLSWVLVGQFTPPIIAVIYSLVTFVLVLRTKDIAQILLAFYTMLLFSDSRSEMLAFAATSKVIVVVLLFAFIVINFRRFNKPVNPIFKFFLPFLLYSVLASAWAVDPFTAFQKSLSYGLVFFIVPVLYSEAEEQDKRFRIDLFYYMLVILCLGLFINLVAPSFTSLVGRYRGLLGNPNGLGIFLVLVFSIFSLIRREHPDILGRGKLYIVFVSTLFVSLVLTGSRTAMVAVLVFIIFNRLRFLSNAFSLVAFLILVLGYEYLLTQIPDLVRLFGLEQYFRLNTLEDGSGRFVAWSFAWERINEVFFLGGGFSYTEFIYKKYFSELSILGHQGNAHNSYLTIWLDTGLLGVLLFSYGLIRSILEALKHSPLTLPIVYAILFSSSFESWLSASLNPFTSLFLIALTILATPEQEPASSNAD